MIKLREAAQRITKGTTPTTYGHDYVESGVAFIRVNNIAESGRLDLADCLYIGHRANALFARSQLDANDVLMSIAGSIGRAAVVDASVLPANCNQAVALIRLRNGYEPKFIARLLSSDLGKSQISAATVQLAQANFSLGQIGELAFRVPTSTEQKAIAGVLDTLDTTILQTEAIIEKLKRVKQGLLHDLLTRGIDANGELRPPQSEAPHLYKESPLGWIPMDWAHPQLGSCTTWASGGTPSKAVRSNWVGPVPLLTPKDMKSFQLADTSEHISARAADTGSRLMPAGTVYIVVRGMILAHSFPVVLSLCPMAFNQDIKAIGVGPSLLPQFLAHWFIANKALFLGKVAESTHGTKKLDTHQLLSIHIGVPPKHEQQAVVDRYAALDERIAKESAYALQSSALKQGLVDDLLTGRVRVTPLLD